MTLTAGLNTQNPLIIDGGAGGQIPTTEKSKKVEVNDIYLLF